VNDQISLSRHKLRRLLFASTIVGLAAVVISHLDRRAREDLAPPSARTRSVEGMREGSRMAPILLPSVAAFDRAANKEESKSVAQAIYAPQPTAPYPKPLPFKLLGKVQDGDARILLLYRAGHVLSIRNATPVDDDYVVDALTEDYVVLRQRSTNESQIIQLAARQESGTAGSSAPNLEPD
jgi:hypothetical protein